jgi:hypothetical protein
VSKETWARMDTDELSKTVTRNFGNAFSSARTNSSRLVISLTVCVCVCVCVCVLVISLTVCVCVKEHYDMSEYSKDSGLYDGENKKVIGKFKDESPDEVIESFVGIRSKCYSFITKNNTVKKAKGVSKVVVKKNITFDDYKKCVLNDTPKRVKINAIRTLKLTNYSLTQDKLALSNKDDKRVWFDKTSSRAYGHFRN